MLSYRRGGCGQERERGETARPGQIDRECQILTVFELVGNERVCPEPAVYETSVGPGSGPVLRLGVCWTVREGRLFDIGRDEFLKPLLRRVE